MALRLEHPDLHWFFPLPRPKSATTPEKLARALEEARWETLAEIRENPLKGPAQEGARTLYLAAARTLRRQAQHRPSMGARQVFIIADAETLAQGESSSEAANALLKLLEEPPEGTTLILTSGEPGRLLPTIRSRSTQLHLSPLKGTEVAAFLVAMKDLDEEEAERLGAMSQGSIGRALRLLQEEDEPGSLGKVRDRALDLLRASLSPSPAGAFQASLGFKSTGARDLMELFESLEEWLRDLALAAMGDGGSPLDPDAEARFGATLHPSSLDASRVAEAMRLVDEARILASGNVNPQLVVFDLLADLRERLLGAPETPSNLGWPREAG
jgi:DNA polymerase-3 subunit delta'